MRMPMPPVEIKCISEQHDEIAISVGRDIVFSASGAPITLNGEAEVHTRFKPPRDTPRTWLQLLMDHPAPKQSKSLDKTLKVRG